MSILDKLNLKVNKENIFAFEHSPYNEGNINVVTHQIRSTYEDNKLKLIKFQ